jgi:hypothetical protein
VLRLTGKAEVEVKAKTEDSKGERKQEGRVCSRQQAVGRVGEKCVLDFSSWMTLLPQTTLRDKSVLLLSTWITVESTAYESGSNKSEETPVTSG